MEDAQDVERNFGRRVRQERLRRSWRQEDLAAKVAGYGVKLHPSAYAKIELGQRTVTLTEAVSISAALGMTLSWMLSAAEAEELEQRLKDIRAQQEQAMTESDQALERAVDLWLESRSLIRRMVSEGEMAATPAEEA